MKKKMLALSDHALSTSGVGTQSRHLFTGLINKGGWSVRQFGAALKHNDYRTVVVNDDFIIKPIDGFGSKDMLRVALATEMPAVLFIFTDPRFFIWLFEMEDEVHQICPIAWWHVWDNHPYPDFNSTLYESTDLINCHSFLTYEMIQKRFPERTNFIPHAVPEEIFFPISKEERVNFKRSILGAERLDHFVGIWVNRNAKRKRPSDVLWSWRLFLDKLEREEGHTNATLIMHADPHDPEGPNLFTVAEQFDLADHIFFSSDRLEFEKMNILYNISDFCLNISYAEGFGLPTLEGMQTGCPVIALKTGGLTRQAVDHRDGTPNGIALDIEFQTLVGSQMVPYIYEDYVSCESVAQGMYELSCLTDRKREKLRAKVRDYALSEFSYAKTVDMWNETLLNLLGNWKEDYKRFECITL